MKRFFAVMLIGVLAITNAVFAGGDADAQTKTLEEASLKFSQLQESTLKQKGGAQGDAASNKDAAFKQCAEIVKMLYEAQKNGEFASQNPKYNTLMQGVAKAVEIFGRDKVKTDFLKAINVALHDHTPKPLLAEMLKSHFSLTDSEIKDVIKFADEEAKILGGKFTEWRDRYLPKSTLDDRAIMIAGIVGGVLVLYVGGKLVHTLLRGTSKLRGEASLKRVLHELEAIEDDMTLSGTEKEKRKSAVLERFSAQDQKIITDALARLTVAENEVISQVEHSIEK